MLEKIKVFSDKKLTDLEGAVNLFVEDINIAPIDWRFYIHEEASKPMYYCMVIFNQYDETEISPKKKGKYKYKK